MKLKLIALAAALAATVGGAQAAAIDNGATGNGGLMFSIWDAASSYSLNLGQTINSFEALVNGAAPLNLAYSADALFTSFLSTATLANLQWNVVATDTSGARRVLETFTPPQASTTIGNAIGRNLSVGTQTFETAVNGSLATANSAIFAVGSTGYAGAVGFSNNGAGLLNFSNSGTLSNNSLATGLGFMRVDAAATGIANSTYTPYAQTGNAVGVYLDAADTLHFAVAAVPEADTYAMLLAGLGLMGAMVRRRKQS